MKYLVPKVITDAMFTSSTIAAPDVAGGETEWVSGGTYALGAERTRTPDRLVYECVLAHTGVATLPANDPTRWLAKRPMNKFAMLDSYINTKSLGPSPHTVVLRPGFMNGLVMYGAVGSTVNVIYKDAPGGTVLRNYNLSLIEGAYGWYEYWFSEPRILTKLMLRDFPLRPDPELTITWTGTGQVGCGLLGVGDFVPLASVLPGGTQFGAKAEPITFSYVKFEADGTVKIVKRGSATNLRLSVHLGHLDGDAALEKVQSILDVPVAIVASDKPGFDGLNGFGLVSASLSYDSAKHRVMYLEQKGFI